MAKVGGNKIHVKYIKSRWICLKQREKFVKVGGKNNFREAGGKCIETGKVGEIQNLWSVTKKKKKKSSEILADENQEICRKKVKLRKFSSESENFSNIGGKSETEGKCIMVSEGMDAPALTDIRYDYYDLLQ